MTDYCELQVKPNSVNPNETTFPTQIVQVQQT
jgi:hypothetical protein